MCPTHLVIQPQASRHTMQHMRQMLASVRLTRILHKFCMVHLLLARCAISIWIAFPWQNNARHTSKGSSGCRACIWTAFNEDFINLSADTLPSSESCENCIVLATCMTGTNRDTCVMLNLPMRRHSIFDCITVDFASMRSASYFHIKNHSSILMRPRDKFLVQQKQ